MYPVMVACTIQQSLRALLNIVCKGLAPVQDIIADNALTRAQPVPEYIG
jgi:hypothetical protein